LIFHLYLALPRPRWVLGPAGREGAIHMHETKIDILEHTVHLIYDSLTRDAAARIADAIASPFVAVLGEVSDDYDIPVYVERVEIRRGSVRVVIRFAEDVSVFTADLGYIKASREGDDVVITVELGVSTSGLASDSDYLMGVARTFAVFAARVARFIIALHNLTKTPIVII